MTMTSERKDPPFLPEKSSWDVNFSKKGVELLIGKERFTFADEQIDGLVYLLKVAQSNFRKIENG